jgi:hypothetical protein
VKYANQESPHSEDTAPHAAKKKRKRASGLFLAILGKRPFPKLGNSRRETFKIGNKIIGQIINLGIYETVNW